MGIRRFNDPNTGRWAPVLTHVSAVIGADGKNLKQTLEDIRAEKVKYENLTPEQQAHLKGEKGDTGDVAVYDPSDPNTPAFEMATTTGQSTTKAMTQKAITDALEDNAIYNKVQLTNASSVKNYYITNSNNTVPYGQWASGNSSNNCIFYPVSPGKTYKITRNGTASFHVIFMTSNATSGTPAYAGDPSEMPAWYSNIESVELVAPSDAAYLYIRNKLSGNVIAPTVEVINYNTEMIEETQTDISTLESNLSDSMASINEHFKIFDSRWDGVDINWAGGIIYDNDAPETHAPGSKGSSSTHKRAAIPNKGYNRIVFYGQTNSNFCMIAFYNSETVAAANLITYNSGTGALRTIDRAIPDGTVTIVISCINTQLENCYVELYAENMQQVASLQGDIASINDDISDINSAIAAIDIEGPIKNSMLAVDQTHVIGRAGSLKSTGAHAINSNYTIWDVPCYEYTHVDARLRGPSTYKVIAFYSAEKPSASTFMSGVAGNGNSITNYSVDIPSGCKCISFCTNNASLSGSWFKVYAPNIGSAIRAKAETDTADIDFYLGRVNDIVSLNDPVGMPHKLTQMKGSGKLMLLHCSDIHYSSSSSYKGKDNYFRILQWWRNYYSYIDDAIATGDLVWDQFSHNFDYWHDRDDENWTNPMLLSIGNHDTSVDGGDYGGSSDYTGGESNDNIYNKFFAPNIANWNLPEGGHEGTNLYYYKDYAKSLYTEKIDNVTVTHIKGVRLIVLNPYNKTEEIRDAQAQWLEDVLTDANAEEPNKMAVIIAAHPSFRGVTANDTGERHAVDCTFSAVGSELKDDAQGKFLRPFALKVENFIKAGGHFICWLSGHHHRDSVFKYRCTPSDDESPWQLQVSIGAATAQQASGNSDIRVDGTKSQDLFNIVSVSTARNILTIVRIGQDYDAFLRHKGTLVINYKTMEVLHND